MPLSFDRSYTNHWQSLRWRAYLSYLPTIGPDMRRIFTDYLCRASNGNIEPPGSKVTAISIHYMLSVVKFPPDPANKMNVLIDEKTPARQTAAPG